MAIIEDLDIELESTREITPACNPTRLAINASRCPYALKYLVLSVGGSRLARCGVIENRGVALQRGETWMLSSTRNLTSLFTFS